MKFNIEVELDYIDEEGCLDEAIKESILASVTKIVMDKVEKSVETQLDDIVVKTAEKKAKQIVARISSDFMNRKFTKVDRYGDKLEDLTVKELLKRKFDSFWNEIVTKNGNTSTYHSDKTKRRIEWKIDELIEKHAIGFAQTLTNDTENKIKTMMKENLSKAIGSKLVSELGFDKMLMESKG